MSFLQASTIVINSSQTNNVEIRIFYGDNVFDSATNISYVADIHPTNLTVPLNYSQSYTCPLSGNVVTAPTFPAPPSYPPVNIQLSYGNCYNLTDPVQLNYCLQAPQNQPLSNYTNSTYNLIVRAPPFPAINQNYTIKQNESKILPLFFNSTISCNAIPIQNLSIILDYNQSMLDNLSNNTYRAPIKPLFTDMNTIMNPGDSIYKMEYGINVSCKDMNKVNEQVKLFFGQQYKNDAINLTVDVEDNTTKFIDFFKNEAGLGSKLGTTYANQSDSFFCYDTSINYNCTNLITVPSNGTGPAVRICLDTADQFCSYEELRTGDVASCLRRYIANAEVSSNQSSQSLNKCLIELSNWQTGNQIVTQVKGDINTNILWIMGAVATILLIVIVAVVMQRSRRLQTFQKAPSAPAEIKNQVKKEIQDFFQKGSKE